MFAMSTVSSIRAYLYPERKKMNKNCLVFFCLAFLPMQFLGPIENGIKAFTLFLSLFSGENLSGLKEFASGQYFSFLCNPKILTRMCDSSGRVNDPTNRKKSFVIKFHTKGTLKRFMHVK